jgi:hypothetical protein
MERIRPFVPGLEVSGRRRLTMGILGKCLSHHTTKAPSARFPTWEVGKARRSQNDLSRHSTTPMVSGLLPPVILADPYQDPANPNSDTTSSRVSV